MTDDRTDQIPPGLFEARYLAFLETIPHLRPRLHRYCTRMTGSVMDGEDAMQEALFDAYRKLDTYDASRPLEVWLFSIAHNRCIDLLRRRKVRARAEGEAAEPEVAMPVEPAALIVGPAMERLVVHLPPKERACVLLKDVFDHSLEEIAVLAGTTVGGVKAALSRGRRKLAEVPAAPAAEATASAADRTLLARYVELFNRRDWDGVRALTSADAQLRVADCFAGRLADSPYFVEYGRPIIPWRMAVGDVDGELAIVILNAQPGGVAPWSLIRIGIRDGQVSRIDDYIKCPWILQSAQTVSLIG